MKKTFIIVALCFAVFSVSAQDKSFQKGNITAGAGIGVAIYGTRLHSESTYGGKTYADDTTDQAASVIYPVFAEYGVTNWLGVGLRYAYSNYFEERDSITGIRSKVTSGDLDLALNFHLVKTKRFDMPICLMAGYSKFKLRFNDPTNQIGKDNGMHYGIMLNPRIYFSDHVGMYFNLGYVGYNYPSIAFSNNTDSDLNDNNNWIFKLKGNGFNIGLGLMAKF